MNERLDERGLDLTNVKPASEILYERFIKGNPERELRMEVLRAEDDVADLIGELRTAAGLTQAELARRIGTSQAAISRAEDARYEGHSLALLRRIARALGKRVVIGFVDLESLAEKDEAAEAVG